MTIDIQMDFHDTDPPLTVREDSRLHESLRRAARKAITGKGYEPIIHESDGTPFMETFIATVPGIEDMMPKHRDAMDGIESADRARARQESLDRAYADADADYGKVLSAAKQAAREAARKAFDDTFAQMDGDAARRRVKETGLAAIRGERETDEAAQKAHRARNAAFCGVLDRLLPADTGAATA